MVAFNMGEVVRGVRDLGVGGLDVPEDLGAILLQCPGDQGFAHAPDGTPRRHPGPAGNLVPVLPKTEWLDLYILESIEEVQEIATGRLWPHNNERPNMGIGGVTPAMKLKMGT